MYRLLLVILNKLKLIFALKSEYIDSRKPSKRWFKVCHKLVVVYNVITGNSVKMYLIVHVKAHTAEMPLKCKHCG